jgi:hypothetical protein
LLGLWVVPSGLGCYFAFFASFTYGLEGFWIGILTGSGLFASALLLQLLCIDWSYELRRHAYLSKMNHDKIETQCGYYDKLLTSVDSRSVGGFKFRSYRDLEEELEEVEAIEDIEIELQDTEP